MTALSDALQVRETTIIIRVVITCVRVTVMAMEIAIMPTVAMTAEIILPTQAGHVPVIHV